MEAMVVKTNINYLYRFVFFHRAAFQGVIWLQKPSQGYFLQSSAVSKSKAVEPSPMRSHGVPFRIFLILSLNRRSWVQGTCDFPEFISLFHLM